MEGSAGDGDCPDFNRRPAFGRQKPADAALQPQSLRDSSGYPQPREGKKPRGGPWAAGSRFEQRQGLREAGRGALQPRQPLWGGEVLERSKKEASQPRAAALGRGRAWEKQEEGPWAAGSRFGQGGEGLERSRKKALGSRAAALGRGRA